MIKKLIVCVTLFLIFIRCTAPEYRGLDIVYNEPINPFKGVHKAIGSYESNHDPYAFNPSEGATGELQIRPIRLQDYNERTGSNYQMRDMYDPLISEKVFMYFASLKGPYDIEGIAKSWNGSGPLTIKYWSKVKLLIK